MPPIELGPTRPVSAVDVRIARQAGSTPEKATTAQAKTPKVELSSALSAGEAPVNTDRVKVIKEAVESGKYPLFPAKIADAMIAAGILLQKGE